MALRIILLLFLGTWSPTVVLCDKAHHHHAAPHTDPASDSLSVPIAASYSASSQPLISSGYSSAPKVSASASAAAAASTSSKVVVAAPKVQEKDKTASERSDTYVAPAASSSSSASYSAPAASYSAPAPAAAPAVSTGNLYYYYYPVAAYPIYGDASSPHPSHGIKPKPSYDRLRNRDSGGHGGGGGGGGGHASSYGGGVSGGGGAFNDLSPFLFMIIPLVAATIAFLILVGTDVTGNVVGRSLGSSNFLGRAFDAAFYRNSQLDEKFGSFAELQAEVDLLLGKYVQALDSDQCMDRIVCELGVKASRIPSKSLLFSVVEWLAPPNHALLGKERIRLMRTAATDDQYNMQTCKQFLCNPPAIVRDGLTLEDLNLRLNKKEVGDDSSEDEEEK